jgi:HAD superfamily phosphoserine phosphatase-like hydrolase
MNMPFSSSATPGPVIAVFDFDGTLVESDSFWPFLGFVAGWPRTAAALLGGLALFASRYLRDKNDPALADHRTFLKAHLLSTLLAGRTVSQLAPSVEKLRGWRHWKENIRQELLRHHAAGHHVVIASGGLDLYLPGLLRDLPHHALICTQMGVKDGVVTGEMISGNCVRLRKAELLADYMAKNGPFAESWGYGNLPHDLPMLNLLKHRVIV